MLQNLIKPNDPVFVFSVLLFIILIFPLLFTKLRLPSIIGLIVAGVLIGPNSFGIIEKNAAIDLLSKIGLLYIMFLAGLEIDLFQVKNRINNTIVFGILTFLIPLIMGIIVGFFILKMNLVTSVLLASMFSSHTLLTYPIISKLGLLKNNSVTATIGGTIITDVLALFILAVIAGSVKNESGTIYWIKFAIFLIIYIAAVAFLIPYIGKLFFKSHQKDDATEYIFVLFIVLLCSYLAYIAGLEPIIGAFLAGLILNSLIPQKSVLMNRINFIGNTIFIPMFLISVGMLVDIKILFSDSKAWIVSISMIIVALLSKLLASVFSQKILKWKKYEAGVSYGMSVNQAAATLAAVLVGYELKFFDEAVLTGTIMMISVTCFVGPLVTDFFGKKVALSQEGDHLEDTLKNLRILVPISNKKNIKDLMEISFILYKKYSTNSIYPTNIVIDSFDVEHNLLEAEKLVSLAVVESVAANINVTPITRVDLNIPSGVLKASRDLRANCIIAGWDGSKSSITRIFSHIIDPMIENSVQLIIINKIIHSYRSFNRIVMLVPPLIERQKGYEELFGVVKNIGEQLQASITLVASEETIVKSEKIIQKTKNTLLNSIVMIKVWKELTNTLDPIIKESDILVLLSARITRPAWQPLLNKLPGIISKKYPKNNIMVMFPSEERWETSPIPENKNMEYLYKILKKEDIYFNLSKYKIFDAFKYILSKKFGSQSDTLKNLATMLTDIFNNEPVQLLEDVVLVHAHISEISDYVIYVGVNNAGFNIPTLQGKIKVIIILLNSVERSPEHHLDLLKEIVTVVRSEGFLDSLKSSSSLKEFEKKLKTFKEKK